tara:strand:+ start:6462 stop:8069 length:1608 start_codon:yes stop_codon:yes gene_type:complete
VIFFASDYFKEEYSGGAELTSEALIESSLLPVTKVKTSVITKELLDKNKNSFWIFGNFSHLSDSMIIYIAQNLNYVVLEYDYKFCIHRSPEKHASLFGECKCHKERRGKLISIFFKKAKLVWFMSKKQQIAYLNRFPFLDNSRVLSSVLSDDTLDFIETINTNHKDDTWLILNSPSWIKGAKLAIEFAKKQKLKYELVWGIEHKQLLEKMSESKGLIYIPPGGDTCPRITIEASLVGCELMLNENVQHKNESWFSDKSKTLSYMRTRKSVFWSSVESLWNLNTANFHSGEETFFIIVIPFYNVEKWIKKCITSIKQQKYNNYKCFLIDDMSSDDSYKIVKDQISGDSRFEVIKNKTKKFALGNIASIINTYSTEENNVNIVIDGDDWLSSINVLSHLNQVYRDKECLLTYGNYVYYPSGKMGVEPSPYPKEVIENNTFRKDKWRASHLRTFKTLLWKKINQQDLKDSDGDYYKTAYDQAMMLPMLEICGEKSEFIEEIMYVYNRTNPFNVDKIKQSTQFKTAQKIRSKEPYERLK